MTLENELVDKAAEKSIENAFRGCLLAVTFSVTSSSLSNIAFYIHSNISHLVDVPWGLDLGRSFQCCGPAHASTAAWLK